MSFVPFENFECIHKISDNFFEVLNMPIMKRFLVY